MKILTSFHDENVLVQFSGHLRPFELKTYRCDNFGYSCNNLTVELIEVESDGRAVSRPIHFSFSINLGTWQKECKTAYDEQIIAMMDEFMHDCSDDLKTSLLDKRDSRKEIHQKLAEFTMPAQDIREGVLVSFSQVMTDEAQYSGFPVYGHEVVEQGHTFYIDDRYCPNPECECDKVHLVIIRRRSADQKVVLSDWCLAMLSLDGKRLEISDYPKCNVREAEQFLRRWLRSEPDVLKAFKWRYKEVRKAAKRSLKNSGQSLPRRIKIPDPCPVDMLPTPAANNGGGGPVGHIGRNQPCLCGSGKKFKKCCGKKA